MRIVVMGTPAFAVPALDALAAAGHQIVAVYTQPPRPGGRRGRDLVPSPVQARAEALGIEVWSPTTLRDAAAQEAFAALAADVAVVAAYGLILPKPVLAAPRLGCINLHASLLPRWRGAAPIQRAILAGDDETGVCVMQMEAGLDTGPVLLERRTSVAGKTAGDLTGELAAMGGAMIVEVLGDIGAYPLVAQPEDGVTYAGKVDKAETRLDFSQDAEVVERQVRAFNPPGVWFEVSGERVRVLAAEVVDHRRPGGGRDRVVSGDSLAAGGPGLRRGDGLVLDNALAIACASGAIRPTLVQRAGRDVMTVPELLRGFPIPAGAQL